MTNNYDLIEALDHIDPTGCTYDEWVQVGMGLKHEGYSPGEWDAWSAKDSRRYHPGECEKKWKSFAGTPNPVTGGTITAMAKDRGWRKTEDYEIAWDGEIGGNDSILDPGWVERKEIIEPDNWNPVNDLIKYLETLFQSDENVGYVTSSFEKDGRHLPTKGNWDRTAGELISALSKCDGDIGSVIGDSNPEVGAWIRFNPLDGGGVFNSNVADYRYALVESDDMPIDQQNAIVRELQLPVAALVHSGKKSLHAIVRIDAKDYDEYKKRVDYLYSTCKKNGMIIDKGNKNPSRLSRMPGIMRSGAKQFLIDTNIGKSTWNEWQEWYEAEQDDMPDFVDFEKVFNDLPDLKPEIIQGILRQGHKMLISGPSKAGKTTLLMQLAVAIAEGTFWLGYQCKQGRVLYVNLELDDNSFLHRLHDVYEKKELSPTPKGIEIWQLRGRTKPMDELAPLLINRAKKTKFDAIIIDPLYKVLTGDENSADQMARFFNNFDRVCSVLGTTVIYAHHHSKGAQIGRSAMERGSGSGVFSRDPDALLDLIELHLDDFQRDEFEVDEKVSAWRLEGTLREFAKPDIKQLLFTHPVHRVDVGGILDDAQDTFTWQKHAEEKAKAEGRKVAQEKKDEEKKAYLRSAIKQIEESGGVAKSANIIQYLKDIDVSITRVTLDNWLKKWSNEFEKKEGVISAKPY